MWMRLPFGAVKSITGTYVPLLLLLLELLLELELRRNRRSDTVPSPATACSANAALERHHDTPANSMPTPMTKNRLPTIHKFFICAPLGLESAALAPPHEFESGPHVRHGANLDVDDAERQGQFPQYVL